MTIDYGARFEKAKQEVASQCLKLFETLYKYGTLTAEFTITMSAVDRETGGISSTKASIVIPKVIRYNTMGRLSGKIRDHQVSVVNDGEGHFRATIDGKEYPRLPQRLVEEELGILVQKKRAGGSSETIGRAVWRHLADRYNRLDRTVSYFDEFVYIERTR